MTPIVPEVPAAGICAAEPAAVTAAAACGWAAAACGCAAAVTVCNRHKYISIDVLRQYIVQRLIF